MRPGSRPGVYLCWLLRVPFAFPPAERCPQLRLGGAATGETDVRRHEKREIRFSVHI